MPKKSPVRWVLSLGTVFVLVAGCSSGSGGTSSPPPSTPGTTAAGNLKGSGGEAAPTLTGELTATNGFKPAEHGFSFQNYGKAEGIPNLTPEEMRRFFGDRVCASLAGGTCVLTPPAEQWMQQTSEGMNGGHCEGMAALALLLYKGTVKIGDIVPGAASAFAPTIQGNDKLAREIAYWFATQALDPTVTGELKTMKPSEIVAKFQESLAEGSTESYTMGIYKMVNGNKSAGHAITPYGIVDKGDGQIEVAVYDNNFPGEARAVRVDTKAETWNYTAAADPKEAASLYEGDANSFSLTLTPTSARLQPQACPFCGAGSGTDEAAKGSAKGSAPGTATDPTGQLFLSTEAGVKGAVVTVTGLDGLPLAGVSTFKPKSAALITDIPAVTEIPAGKAFRVKIDGSALKEAVRTDLTYIGPDLDLYVDGINLDPGQVDTAQFDPATGALTYETAAGEAPTIGIGFSATGTDYDFSVGGVDLPQGGKVEAKVDQATGAFTIRNLGTAAGTYAVSMDRIDEAAGEQTFTNDAVELPPAGTLALDYLTWTGAGDQLTARFIGPEGGAGAATELSDDK